MALHTRAQQSASASTMAIRSLPPSRLGKLAADLEEPQRIIRTRRAHRRMRRPSGGESGRGEAAGGQCRKQPPTGLEQGRSCRNRDLQ